MIDSRLVGRTAENLFLSLLNQRGVFAASSDTAGFDGIAFDSHHKCFKVGRAPFFVQIKCRGSVRNTHNAQGHSPRTIESIRVMARELGNPAGSLNFVVGFFKRNDVRTIVYYGIPFGSPSRFKTSGQYRFSVARCEAEMQRRGNPIFRL